jgi:hypothetical protein
MFVQVRRTMAARRHQEQYQCGGGRPHRARAATTEQITAEYPTVTAAGVRAAAAYGAVLAREEILPIPQSQ